MRDIAKTVIMQYQHSPRLLELIEAFFLPGWKALLGF